MAGRIPVPREASARLSRLSRGCLSGILTAGGFIEHTLTLDDLAGLISRGFDAVYARINQVAGRFDKLELRMDNMEHRMSAFERGLTDHNERFYSIERQFAIELARQDVRLSSQERELLLFKDRSRLVCHHRRSSAPRPRAG